MEPDDFFNYHAKDLVKLLEALHKEKSKDSSEPSLFESQAYKVGYEDGWAKALETVAQDLGVRRDDALRDFSPFAIALRKVPR